MKLLRGPIITIYAILILTVQLAAANFTKHVGGGRGNTQFCMPYKIYYVILWA